MKQFRRILIPLFMAAALIMTAAAAEAASDEVVFKQYQTKPNSTTIVWNHLYKETKTAKIQSYKLTWGPNQNTQTNSSPELSPKTRKYEITGLNSNSNYFVEIYYTVKEETPTPTVTPTPSPSPTPTAAPSKQTKTTTYKRGLTIYTAPGKITDIDGYDYLYTQTGFEIYWDKPSGENKNYYQYELYSKKGVKLMSGQTDKRIIYRATFQYSQQVTRFRVRALHKNPSTGVVLTGEWSNLKPLIPQPILKLNASKYSINENGKLKIAWNRINGASKYYIYASKTPIGGYKKIGEIKQKKKQTIGISLKKNFKLNRVYYIKVLTVVSGMGKSEGRYFLPIWRYDY